MSDKKKVQEYLASAVGKDAVGEIDGIFGPKTWAALASYLRHYPEYAKAQGDAWVLTPAGQALLDDPSALSERLKNTEDDLIRSRTLKPDSFLNASNEKGVTEMMRLASHGKVEGVKALLHAGADIGVKTKTYWEYYVGSAFDDWEAVNVPPGSTARDVATIARDALAAAGKDTTAHDAVLEALGAPAPEAAVGADAPPPPPPPSVTPDQAKIDAFIVAATHGKWAQAEAIATEVADGGGDVAALFRGTYEGVEADVRPDPDLDNAHGGFKRFLFFENFQALYGTTALYGAVSYSKDITPLLQIVADHGVPADVLNTHNLRDTDDRNVHNGGATPLRTLGHWGGEPGSMDYGNAQALLDAGADVNAPAANGVPPLHVVAWNRNHSMGRLFLSRGADPTARLPAEGLNKEVAGKTSAEIAAGVGDAKGEAIYEAAAAAWEGHVDIVQNRLHALTGDEFADGPIADVPSEEQARIKASILEGLDAAGKTGEAHADVRTLLGAEPVAEEPVAEEPVAEEPVAEEAVAEEAVAEEAVAEEAVAEEAVAEEAVAEEAVAEEAVAEEAEVEGGGYSVDEDGKVTVEIKGGTVAPTAGLGVLFNDKADDRAFYAANRAALAEAGATGAVRQIDRALAKGPELLVQTERAAQICERLLVLDMDEVTDKAAAQKVLAKIFASANFATVVHQEGVKQDWIGAAAGRMGATGHGDVDMKELAKAQAKLDVLMARALTP
jgi:hypothetical protein